MLDKPTSNSHIRPDLDICRALYEKNPDKAIELLSDWMEANRLTTSERFQLPAYLKALL